MKNEEVDEQKLAVGGYCRKGLPDCFCGVGWPHERRCPKCRDNWGENEFRDSYCVCAPDEVVPTHEEVVWVHNECWFKPGQYALDIAGNGPAVCAICKLAGDKADGMSAIWK